MTNVVKIKPNMNVRMDVIRVVVDAGVRAAFANFNNFKNFKHGKQALVCTVHGDDLTSTDSEEDLK